MRPIIRLFSSPEKLADSVAADLTEAIKQKTQTGEAFHLVLSGGSTPEILYRRLARPPYRELIRWQHLHLYWGDERCVPPGHSDSNYGMTRRALLNAIGLAENNIHRIRGEDKPLEEARRYAGEIEKNVPKNESGWPRFDWIFLGVGTDGHTASLFPDSQVLRIDDKICAVSTHPSTGQKRITLTLPVINNAARLSFFATGEKKKEVVSMILKREPGYHNLPAGLIQPASGNVEFCLDNGAASLLTETLE